MELVEQLPVAANRFASFRGQREAGVRHLAFERLRDQHEAAVFELAQMPGEVALREPGYRREKQEVRGPARGERRENGQACGVVHQAIERRHFLENGTFHLTAFRAMAR